MIKNVLFARILEKDISSFSTASPLGILSLIPEVKKRFPKINCYVFDNSIIKNEFSRFKNTLNTIKPDVIFFSITYTEKDIIKKYLSISKTINKNIKTVCGGAGITCNPEEFLEFKNIDYICHGTGEEKINWILDDIKTKYSIIPSGIGRIYNKNTEFKISDSNHNNTKINTPDWSYLDHTKYNYLPCYNAVVKRLPYSSVMTSRGCPFNCPFCNNILGNKIICRPIDEIIEELKLLKNMGVKEIHFTDDTFNLPKKRAKNLLKAIIKKDFGFTISFQGTRFDHIDQELLFLMKKAGGFYLEFGIQHINDNLLKEISRPTDIENIKKNLEYSQKIGFITETHFMYNLPNETYKDHVENRLFAKSLNTDLATFFKFTPYPGTDLGNKYIKDFKQIPGKSFHFYNKDPRLNIAEMSRKEILKIQDEAYNDFYFNTKRIIRLIKKIPINSVSIKRNIYEFINKTLL